MKNMKAICETSSYLSPYKKCTFYRYTHRYTLTDIKFWETTFFQIISYINKENDNDSILTPSEGFTHSKIYVSKINCNQNRKHIYTCFWVCLIWIWSEDWLIMKSFFKNTIPANYFFLSRSNFQKFFIKFILLSFFTINHHQFLQNFWSLRRSHIKYRGHKTLPKQ